MTKEEIQKQYFNENEAVLWSGTADALRYFTRTDFVLVPLSLLFGGMLLTYAFSAFVLMAQGKSMAFSLSGITCVLIGMYLIFGRIWYRHKRLSKNIYFVTENRVFVFNTLRNTVTVDIPIADALPEILQNTLFLGRKQLGSDLLYGLGLDVFFHRFTTESPAFYAISNPELVKKQIKQAKKMRKWGKQDADDFI